MTNGPDARIAEIAVNPVPRPRTPHDIHRHPDYYAIRNHIVEFLLQRSRQLAMLGREPDCDPRYPPLIRFGMGGATSVPLGNRRGYA
jgi:nitrate/nitrite transport system ATP-binding protein